MKLSEAMGGEFLKKEDLGDKRVKCIIDGFTTAKFKEGDKYVMSFRGSDKSLVLNATNLGLLQDHFGDVEFDDLVGKEVVIFNDKTVTFNGKRGGIRFWFPRVAAETVSLSTASDEPPTPSDDDNVPF